MSQATSTDYSKILPLIPSIKKIVNEFEGEEKRVALEFLLRDALAKTTQEIVKESHQLPAPETPQKNAEPENPNFPSQTMPTREIPPQSQPSSLRLDASKIDSFLKRQNLSPAMLEKLFLQNGEKIERLYASLNTTKKAEGQVRVSLLKCLANGIQSGELSSAMEDIISECKDFGIFDGNLSKNLNNRKSLFGVLNKERVKLNAQGEKELAELVKELTQQES